MAETESSQSGSPLQRDRRRVIIVGGGIGGLTAAFRLGASQRASEMDITLLEAGGRLGGIIQTEQFDDFIVEMGPDSIIRTKPAAMELAKELGISEQDFQSTNPDMRTCYVTRGDRLLPIPKGFYLMAPGNLPAWFLSKTVSLRAKVRACADLFLPVRVKPDDESLGDFVARRLGREVLERLAQPLIAGIYGADPYALSLQATMPQFIQMERNHGGLIRGVRRQARQNQAQRSSGARYGLFFSFPSGMQTFTDALLKKITGVSIETNSPVSSITYSGNRWTVHSSQKTYEADMLVLALPANLAAPLTHAWAPDLSGMLAAVPYGSVATLSLAFDAKNISGIPRAAGFVVPNADSETIIACTFCDQKYAGRVPNNKRLLRVFAGGFAGRQALDLNDDELTKTVLRELSRWLEISAAPDWVKISRWENSMAHYHIGHLDRLAEIRHQESRFPGLALIGNAYEGVGIPDIIAQANRASERLLAS